MSFMSLKILILPLILHELLLLSMPQFSTSRTGVFVTFACGVEIPVSTNACADIGVMEVL